MVIDFHTHTFPDKIASYAVEKLSHDSGTMPYTDGTDAGLLASMAQSKITNAVILPVATNPDKVSHMNSRICAQRDGALIHFGAMHPDCPDWKNELRQLADCCCKGIKIHPVYQNTDLDDFRYLRILEEAGALGLIVVTHSGDDIGFPGVVHCSPAMAANALRQVGPVKLVLAHMGGWHQWEEAAELLAGTSAYFDTSFSYGQIALRPETPADTDIGLMSAEQMANLIRTFGADRVLFGTDSPWSGQRQALEAFENLPLKQEEKEFILWKNSAKLLNIT